MVKNKSINLTVRVTDVFSIKRIIRNEADAKRAVETFTEKLGSLENPSKFRNGWSAYKATIRLESDGYVSTTRLWVTPMRPGHKQVSCLDAVRIMGNEIAGRLKQYSESMGFEQDISAKITSDEWKKQANVVENICVEADEILIHCSSLFKHLLVQLKNDSHDTQKTRCMIGSTISIMSMSHLLKEHVEYWPGVKTLAV